MKATKWSIIAGAVICNAGLVLACTDLGGTLFPDGKACQASPCAYDQISPACGYCGIVRPGDNCTKTPGSDYPATLQHYINGTCVNGWCQDGDPDGDPIALQCYGFGTPACGG
jgi:hypothetical protein